MRPRDDGISLVELWQTIWSGRLFVAIVVAGLTLLGFLYAFLAQEWYRAEVVLAPVDRQSIAGGGLSSLGGLGGLAALAGVNLPASGGRHPVAVLRSKDFARGFIEDQALEAVLLEDLAGAEPLDMRDAVRVFDTRVRSVGEDTRAGLVRLSIRWKDADTAAAWANAYAQRLNQRLRQQAAEEAERNISYLTKEMTATNVVSLQQSLGSLLEGEMQKLLLTRGNDEFAFRVVDPAVAPKQRDSPKRALVIVVAFVAGLFLAILSLAFYKAVRGGSRT